MVSTCDGNKTSIFSNVLPVGIILPYAGDIPPEGFLICNGSSISRQLYQNLFNVIGTKYYLKTPHFLICLIWLTESFKEQVKKIK